MKAKNWLKILIFVLVIVALTVGAAAFLHVPEARDVTGMYGFYLEEENSLDVVLIGPSPVYTGFYSPLAYEQEQFTSYAVSTGGLSGAMYPSAIRETRQTQDPQLYVIDLSGFCDVDQKDSAAVRRWIDSIAKGENRQQSIEELVSEEEQKSYRIPFTKYHSNWTRIKGCWKAMIDKTDQKKRGYSVTKNFCAYTDTSETAEITEEIYDFSEEGYAALEQFLDFLKQEQIENVIFVRFPRRNMVNDGERYTEGTRSIQEAGYVILDYCQDDVQTIYPSDTIHTYNGHKTALDLNVHMDFYDAEHVNIYGAEKLTKDMAAFIGERLTERHSGQRSTENWEKAASQNTQVLDKAKQLTQDHANQGLYTQKDFLN